MSAAAAAEANEGDRDDGSSRLAAELDLLATMYPEAVSFSAPRSELSFTPPAPPAGVQPASRLILRIPPAYLSTRSPSPPEVLVAQACGADVRDEFASAIAADLSSAGGEEVLDVLLGKFGDLAAEKSHGSRRSPPSSPSGGGTGAEGAREGKASADKRSLTVVVWLHHLLATGKRKQALAAGPGVSGVTKPGYPGVMVFSGEADRVKEHVAGLRALNWQAFQVRLEEETEWGFEHGNGMREVESMGEVVRCVEEGQQREVLVSCLGIKG